MYLFTKYILETHAGSIISDVLLLLSAFVNIIQIIIMAILLRFTEPIKYEEFYIGDNADKKFLIICGIIIIKVLILGKYLMRYHPIIVGSLALSLSTLLINLKNSLNL